jgi:hypothetical protein
MDGEPTRDRAEPRRIAVLVSGRVENFAETRDNFLRNIVQDSRADVFVSHSPEIEEDLAAFAALYRPVVLRNDDIAYPDVSKYVKRHETNKHNVMCMFINRKRAFSDFAQYQEAHGIAYDLVISCRLDMEAREALDYSVFSDRGDSVVYIPSPKTDRDYGGINDQMAVGSPAAMLRYMLTYDDLFAILDSGATFHPETLLKKYLDLHRVDCRRFAFDYELAKNRRRG